MAVNLGHLSEDKMKEILLLQERLQNLNAQEDVRDSFLEYVKYIWPEFIEGEHHQLFAEKLDRIANGDIKRLIVNMPPRHTKSEFASVYFPSWVMGLRPNLKIMQTTHTAELSVRFGRKVRNLMATEEYKSVFPDVGLRADSKSAGRWDTDQAGEYFAAGVGGAITGRCLELGLNMNIVNFPGQSSVWRIAPPLTVASEEIDEALTILEQAIGECL